MKLNRTLKSPPIISKALVNLKFELAIRINFVSSKDSDKEIEVH